MRLAAFCKQRADEHSATVRHSFEQAVYEAYRDGASMSEIALHAGISKSGVHAIIHRWAA